MTAVSRLDKAGATRRAQSVRDGVNAVNDLIGTIVEIEERQDWLLLGYKGWGDYFEAEFGPNQLRLSQEQRGVIVAVLAASGMSRRKIARWLGVDEKTLRNDAKGAEKSALPAANAQVKTSAGGKPVEGEPAVSGSPEGPDRASDSDASGSAAGVGVADPPSPAAPQAPPVEIPGDAEDEGPTGGEPSGVAGAATPATQTGPDGPAPVDSSSSVDGREQRQAEGVSVAAAPGPEIPSWLHAITAVVTTVHELIKEDPATVGSVIAADLAEEFGSTYDLFHDWYLRMQDHTP